jgi:uncharacterized protein (TIGR02598 family)
MNRQSNRAFSLVEVTLALGIAAFCLLAVFGLMPVGVQTNRNAISQAAATNIVTAVTADLRATPKNSNTSLQYHITFGTNPLPMYFDGAGQVATTLGTNSRYQLNITWSGSTRLRYADIRVSWPAAASPTNSQGSVETFAAFDRN